MGNYHRKRSYQIVLEGIHSRLEDERLAGWSLSSGDEGCTLLSATGVDSASLYGAIAVLRDRGLVLLSIRETSTTTEETEEERCKEE